ncbi:MULTISPECIES: hypothetical protein [Protofrankia]|uniref:Uncharacterized protein n=1 Tax=Protofrankia coriariae TaxID=1562887 RepID=A0ABR5F4H3_9ACTN|nr:MULTISPECIES: hypothetical protein [Protofrankia]KLL11570.1 hypothetical protein FrCorBMG51_11060 [Protofrankia coriariae]ONH35704.1 hypothetical protein BL254_10455 [Protofrankia sp. BMG5.30]
MSAGAELLTAQEKRVVELLAEVAGLLGEIVGPDEPARSGDVAELVHHVHAIQNTVLSQAAARAYPTVYRLLGGSLPTVPAADGG